MCGEAVVLYENAPCLGGSLINCTCCHVYNTAAAVPSAMPRTCCNAENVILPCVKNADELANAINETRKMRLQQQNIVVETDLDR